jgi:hypothetical protein
MSKNNTPKVHAPKAPRTKTPVQLVKRERNIAAYNARNEAMQREREAAMRLRRTYGYVGTDDQVLAKHALAEADRAVQAKQAEEARFVDEALAGPSSYHLDRWLAGRLPTFERVSRFFEKSSLPRVAKANVAAAA